MPIGQLEIVSKDSEGVSEVIAPEASTIKRTIGVEIECLVPDYLEDDTRDNLRDAGGSVHGDGSIDGDGEGIEVKTAPIKGRDAEDTITEICGVLQEADADTNSSCGLHVHVDAKEVDINNYVRSFSTREDVKADETVLYVHKEITGSPYRIHESFSEILNAIEQTGTLKVSGRYGAGRMVHGAMSPQRDVVDSWYGTMPESQYASYTTLVVQLNEFQYLKTRLFEAMRFFSAIDPIMRSLVPSSRRHNTYCQPFEKMARSGGRCPNKYSDLMDGIRDRYCGINMRALEAHGTIENRYHGGTVDASKIIHWARLWERCVDVAMSRYAGQEADALCEVVNGKNRLEMLLALCNVPESTEQYMMQRYTKFMGSDARHTISYVKAKKANRK